MKNLIKELNVLEKSLGMRAEFHPRLFWRRAFLRVKAMRTIGITVSTSELEGGEVVSAEGMTLQCLV